MSGFIWMWATFMTPDLLSSGLRSTGRALLGSPERCSEAPGRCGNESVYTNMFLGDNNWPAIRAALQKVNYDGWLIAEMEARYRYAPTNSSMTPLQPWID
jgi:hypothetical protein